MPTPTPSLTSARSLLCCACLAALLASGLARAEKADRNKPVNISSERGGRLDVVNQRTEFNGNVILSKGSMLLKAERMDVRETSDGYHQAYASGETGKPVQFRQARDVAGEAIEGTADQLEYDSRSDTVRFVGNAVVRRVRGDAVADEITGALIVYDNRSEVFSVDGGLASPHPSGRVRVVLMPRAGNAASAAEGSAPPPASAPLPLQTSPTLQTSPRKPNS